MFFANALKDYVDQINDLYILLNDNFTVVTVLKSFLLYFFDSIKLYILYLFSFKWLIDFIELPCTFKMNYNAIFSGQNVLETNVIPSYFEFLEIKPLSSNLFVTGFLNSFFLALPFSVPHLLTLRFFLINGLPAGLFSAAGTIVGQFLFFICVFFGFEFLLIPFFSFEPLNYILGFLLIINVLYNLLHKPNMEVLNSSQISTLLPIFGLNFFLAWTEQTSIFQYFGNLTINSFPTLLQGGANTYQNVSSNLFFNFILPNSFYLSGILIGSILWTALFGFGVMLLRNKIAQLSQTPFMFLNERIHNFTLFLIFTFCLTSVPYYGLNYVISGPLGFLDQDKALTAFTPKSFSIKIKDEAIYTKSVNNPIPFDRSKEFQRTLLENTAVFEDTSFDPENYWFNRETFYTSLSSKSKGQNLSKQLKKTKSKTVEIAQAKKLRDTFYNANVIDKKQLKLTKKEAPLIQLASQAFDPLAYSYYEQLDDSNIIPELLVRHSFRKKFFSNLFYKALVDLDMRGFLQGQPSSYNMTALDEANLYKRHDILKKYLNSISDYKTSDDKQANKLTYADNVYNQQFKGSLDLVRHYFLISLSEQPLENKKILKFDQRLYNTDLKKYSPLLHEELLESQFELNESKTNETLQNLNTLPQRLEEVDTTPFYVGWDGGLRKFLVKTAWTSGISVGNSTVSDTPKEKGNTNELPTYFSFQSWPLNLLESDLSIKKPAVTPYIPLSEETVLKLNELFGFSDLVTDTDSGDQTKMEKVLFLQEQAFPNYNWNPVFGPEPKSLKKYVDLKNTLPPQFGGLAWPGNFDPQSLFKKTSGSKKADSATSINK